MGGAAGAGGGAPPPAEQAPGVWKQRSTSPALWANAAAGSTMANKRDQARISDRAVGADGELRRQADHQYDRLTASGLAAADDVVVGRAELGLVGTVAGELSAEA